MNATYFRNPSVALYNGDMPPLEEDFVHFKIIWWTLSSKLCVSLHWCFY